MNHVPANASFQPGAAEEVLTAIRECLANIRFGSIAITLHEGKIVQFDVTEKRRLSR